MKSKNWFCFHSGSAKRLSRGEGEIAGMASSPASRRIAEPQRSR